MWDDSVVCREKEGGESERKREGRTGGKRESE